MDNKKVWKKWINYYNEIEYGVYGESFGLDRKTAEESIEKRFYEVVPKTYRNLMNALISCLKWHPDNLESRMYMDTNTLCGHCYNTYIKYKENNDSIYFCIDVDLCIKYCALHKKTKECCLDCDTTFDSAADEIEAATNAKDLKSLPNCKKMYKTLLSIYREEYEKLFGKDWDK